MITQIAAKFRVTTRTIRLITLFVPECPDAPLMRTVQGDAAPGLSSFPSNEDTPEGKWGM